MLTRWVFLAGLALSTTQCAPVPLDSNPNPYLELLDAISCPDCRATNPCLIRNCADAIETYFTIARLPLEEPFECAAYECLVTDGRCIDSCLDDFMDDLERTAYRSLAQCARLAGCFAVPLQD